MAILKLIYYHIVYWMVGTTPEAHHANLANTYYDLGISQKCIDHCLEYLKYADDDYVKGMLGYSYGELGDWESARSAYRSMSDFWEQPAFALAVAESEIQCGNHDEARRIISRVKSEYVNLTSIIDESLRYLDEQLSDKATD